MNTLVLQSFGRENEYKRAVFAILSFYAHMTLEINETKVILFTDNPSYFEQSLSELPVQYILLTPEKIKWMRGEIDFLHRMKIALIEEAFTASKGILLYVDSDTFFIKDPVELFLNVSESAAYMHLLEYPFVREVEDETSTYQEFYELINNEEFELAEGRKLRVTSQHCSWNAGVMVFHPLHSKFINDVYSLTNQFYPSSGSHASEQYAFSIVLQEHLQLKSCDHIVYHYWYRVKKQIIDLFLNKHLFKIYRKPLNEKLKIVKQWSSDLPNYFETHQLMTKDHAIQAFNKNNFAAGYKWASKALLQKPFFDMCFLKDILYHFKRHLKNKLEW